MEDVKTGVITHVSDRGFGFIKDPTDLQNRKGIFFHASALRGGDFSQLARGMNVEYSDLITDDRGTSAKKVFLSD